jgi:hypothetical protein
MLTSSSQHLESQPLRVAESQNAIQPNLILL